MSAWIGLSLAFAPAIAGVAFATSTYLWDLARRPDAAWRGNGRRVARTARSNMPTSPPPDDPATPNGPLWTPNGR